MPLIRRNCRAIVLQCGCYWLLLLAISCAQHDLNTASVLESSAPSWPGQTFVPPATNFNAQMPAGEMLPVPMSGPPLTGWPATSPGTGDYRYHFDGQARGYYLNDQRIEFTGVEASFAVEGVLEGGISQRVNDWDVCVESQFFLSQPFGKNVYANSPLRQSFAQNYDIEPLEISQLYIGARNGDFYLALGRFVTPFGRFYFPNYRNNFDDSPFIRSEAILFRETGLVMQWDPGIWVCTAAVTNGSFQQDTNSSKALVARVGIDQPWYAIGASVKWQDGNGSEEQKVYNNHAGCDAMVRFGNWTLSSEAIYDQYGLRRPGTALNDITWGRSLYFRDLNNGYHIPITGFGYYVNLGYEGPQWSLMFNYGEFYPEDIGDIRHDNPTRRGLIKASRHWTPNLETYGVVMLENDLVAAFDGSLRRGTYLMCGAQFTW